MADEPHGAAALAPPAGALRNLDRPGARPREPGEQTQQRALAGAVRAEHRDDVAGRELEVEGVQGNQRAEALLEAAGAQHEAHAAPESVAPHCAQKRCAASAGAPQRAQSGLLLRSPSARCAPGGTGLAVLLRSPSARCACGGPGLARSSASSAAARARSSPRRRTWSSAATLPVSKS